MYGFVYIWRDKKHKRFYIGSHWGTIDDGYVCSSTWMKNSYKRRPFDFKRKIVSFIYTNRKDLLLEEFKWLSLIKADELGKRYYNLTTHLNGHWSTDDNKAQTMRQRISETKKKYWSSDESKKNREQIVKFNKENGITPPSRKGKVPWNKGLSKSTDERVKANAEACKKPKSNTEKMGRYKRKK